ncbi:SlyX family protein [Marinagarivorans cellulosilyticus]|uniref:SlyX protein n=1 Tax=Marinagarivorans cellulosilyticus TaxID=2721545 RepID=A0AAN1WFT4_9GAMM|nr:SlyX family protein [Marinagarivorans cellulosilyticus]BCD96778.1 SlyX protein [Marinagarivorans cellulosilyticus]
MNNDIVELQQRLAFQEDAIAKLSDHIALQDRDLLEAKQHIQILREKFLELSDEFEQIAPANGNERPPHY